MGAGCVPAPSPPLSSNPSNAPSVRNVQNGAHVQPPLQGASNTANASAAAKQLESATTQRSTRAVPKAPTSQHATVSSDSGFPMTPTKGLASGDASQAFTVQFGSISPGFMNGMQLCLSRCLGNFSLSSYSARDEEEVALCIKDLKSPSFHPSMIALFIMDSFERKDVERDLLAKLLVNLTRSNDGVLSQVQLVKGFESVLSTLEDAVNDAPKAAEFLGRIFARLIIENVLSLRDIGRLIYDSGEEPGSLREVGLAGDVLGSTLGIIKTENGESVFNEIRSSSNLRLEDFRPPDPNKSRLLETFI